MTHHAVLSALRTFKFTFASEAELQVAIAEAFVDAGIEAQREVEIEGAGRIDFLVGTIGIEIKIRGGVVEVAEQLQRYAHSPHIAALVLVTTRRIHSNELPATIGGKPVAVIVITGGIS